MQECRRIWMVLALYEQFLQKQRQQNRLRIERSRQQLPIYAYREKILELIERHQVLIVSADTGAGKSTQVPQYLMEAGYDKAC